MQVPLCIVYRPKVIPVKAVSNQKNFLLEKPCLLLGDVVGLPVFFSASSLCDELQKLYKLVDASLPEVPSVLCCQDRQPGVLF